LQNRRILITTRITRRPADKTTEKTLSLTV